MEFSQWLKESTQKYRQLLIKGYTILPKVTEGDFDRLPMDGWYGGDKWSDDLQQWVPQEKTSRPNIVWAEHQPFWILIVITKLLANNL